MSEFIYGSDFQAVLHVANQRYECEKRRVEPEKMPQYTSVNISLETVGGISPEYRQAQLDTAAKTIARLALLQDSVDKLHDPETSRIQRIGGTMAKFEIFATKVFERKYLRPVEDSHIDFVRDPRGSM